MLSFIQRHRDKIRGILNGLDRIRFRGTLRAIAHAWGIKHFLMAAGVLVKDFKDYALDCTREVYAAAEVAAKAQARPFLYLRSPETRKEDLARSIAQRDGVTQGLVAVFRSVENCRSFELVSHNGFLRLESHPRKCLHFYHYFLDPDFGLMHARVQSWLPFTIQVCLNGREWLARLLDRAGIGYHQRDNCFVDITDFQAAQRLADRQVRYDWQTRLDRMVDLVQPAHAQIFASRSMPYYWSVEESEWATDLAFHRAEDLAALYPRLVRYGIEGMSCRDVLRYLGRKQPSQCPTADVLSDYQVRPEGIRLKHRLNRNVVKMYDKQETVLRVETIINNPEDFKVYRAAEGSPDGPKSWRKMRKGVADLERRVEVSQAANARYLESLAAVEAAEPVAELAAGVCRTRRWQGRSVRALNPLAQGDGALLEAVNSGAFAVNGFRNRDLRVLLYGETRDPVRHRQQSGKVTRQLRLLRAHGLIKKVAKTHRYVLTKHGPTVIAALLAARKANTATLLAAC